MTDAMLNEGTSKPRRVARSRSGDACIALQSQIHIQATNVVITTREQGRRARVAAFYVFIMRPSSGSRPRTDARTDADGQSMKDAICPFSYSPSSSSFRVAFHSKCVAKCHLPLPLFLPDISVAGRASCGWPAHNITS